MQYLVARTTPVVEDPTNLAGVQKENKKSVLWQSLLKLLKRARHARKQALQAHHELSHMPFTLDSGYDMTSVTQVEGHKQPPHGEGLLGDPFLGSGTDFVDEMSGEQLDTWVQSFQPDLFYWQESMDFQMNTLMGALSWW